jgi:uncharacterized repeat protein (TIGR02543 family)
MRKSLVVLAVAMGCMVAALVGCSKSPAAPPVKYELTVNATFGSVTKTPDQTEYITGSSVGLKAHPYVGYHFVNWSGDAIGATDSVTVTMDAAKTVTANFAINSYALTVTGANGSVTKLPDQPQYDSNSSVVLNAHANAGYRFVNWTGDASGTDPLVSVTMNGAKNVTANFVIVKYALTVAAANGSVAKTPDQPEYDSGSTVTLTPTPVDGYHFVKWSGDTTDTATALTLTMKAAMNVTANFAPNSIDVYGLYTDTATSASPANKPVIYNWANTCTHDAAGTDAKNGATGLVITIGGQGWAGVGIQAATGSDDATNGVDVSAYTTMHFWIKSDIAAINACFQSADLPGNAPTADITQYGYVADGQWHEVNIPFTAWSAVNPAKANVFFGIVFVGTGEGGQTVALDDIWYTK